MTRVSDRATQHASFSASQVVLRSKSAIETRRFGALLGALLEPGDVVLLVGGLGAGKTVFVQGIGEGLGVKDVINSPTFTILKEYSGRVPLYHFDLYRVEDPDELVAIGFEEYFDGDGICVVEWAERGEVDDGGGSAWPASWLRISFHNVSSSERILRCSAMGRRGQTLLAGFAHSVGAKSAGNAVEDR